MVDFHLYLNNSKIVRTLRDDGIKDMIKKSWQSTYFHPLGLIQSPMGLVTADSSNTELASLSSLLITTPDVSHKSLC